MINLKPGTRVFLSCRPIDLRKGFNGLVALITNELQHDSYSGHLFVFRGKRGDYLKMLYWDGTGLCLFAKRLEQGIFAWPPVIDDCMTLSQGQFTMLTEGIDWRRTVVVPAPQRPVSL